MLPFHGFQADLSFTLEEGTSKRLLESGRSPRELLPSRIPHHRASAIVGDHSAIRVENDESGNALHLELLAQLVFRLPIAVWQSKPWHLREVFIKGRLVLVRRHKHNLETFLFQILRVKLSELGCKATA